MRIVREVAEEHPSPDLDRAPGVPLTRTPREPVSETVVVVEPVVVVQPVVAPAVAPDAASTAPVGATAPARSLAVGAKPI